ncbi:hypothetical protein M3221_12715 [Domibacillus indicus]|uniref:hypothetical protein n=1 Tax=Domibacillus indicus TaxID=1437523 RepID=UPI00203BD5E0|nr:hypothetical protein [Domibacillus indicus]MCM3789264.1 hypothetical protein [Domibacillus indicus]
MSVISASQEHDRFIIEPFVACEEGVAFSWEKASDFHIGETVYYLDGFKDPDSLFSQNHLSWMV